MCCRLHVVPEPVDVDFFNPKGVTPLELPLGKLVFGRARSEAKTVAFLSVSLCQFPTYACCARQQLCGPKMRPLVLQALVAKSQTTYLELGLLVYNKNAITFSVGIGLISVFCTSKHI